MPVGVTAIDVAPGIYIVSNGAEARRVMVR